MSMSMILVNIIGYLPHMIAERFEVFHRPGLSCFRRSFAFFVIFAVNFPKLISFLEDISD